jgi:hypothetical protein
MKYSYDRTADTRIALGVSTLDVKNLSSKATAALDDLDEKFIGTADYMGVAFFWDTTYKWWLRDATPKVRRQVHEAFRKANLKVDDVSDKHREVLAKFFPDAKKKLEEMDE